MPATRAVGFTWLAAKDGRLETRMFAILVSFPWRLGALQVFIDILATSSSGFAAPYDLSPSLACDSLWEQLLT